MRNEEEKKRAALQTAGNGVPVPDYEWGGPITAWVRAATRALWFPPDRRRVRRELREHLEEKRERHHSVGRSWQEAEELAVAEMGDPAETGQLLRAVHKPWLGWTLRAVRLVLLLLLFAVAVQALKGRIDMKRFGFMSRETVLSDVGILDLGEEVMERYVIARRDAVCEDEAEFGPYHVACERVAFEVYQQKECDESGAYDVAFHDNVSVVLLRLTAAPWHNPSEKMLQNAIRIVDDQGRTLWNYNKTEKMERPGWFRSWTCRVRPWETDVAIVLNIPNEIQCLDIYLEQGEVSRRFQVRMDDWRAAKEDMPHMDAEAAVRAEAGRSPCRVALNFVTVPDAVRVRNAAPTKAERLSPMEVSIPWARQCLYRENDEKMAAFNDKFRAEYTTHWTDRSPGEGEVVECVVMVRGDVSEFPVPYWESLFSLRITDPSAAPDAQEIAFNAELFRKVWYADGCVWRLQWTPRPGADSYVLHFTEPGGGTCTLNVELGEETAP